MALAEPVTSEQQSDSLLIQVAGGFDCVSGVQSVRVIEAVAEKE